MQLLVKCYDIKTVWVPTFLFTCVDKRGDLTDKKESRIGMQKVLLIFVPIHYFLTSCRSLALRIQFRIKHNLP